jgi:hypothetical protein
MARRADDEPINDEIDPSVMPSQVGTIHQLIEYPRKRRVKRRPIGFLANIDEWIEDDD